MIVPSSLVRDRVLLPVLDARAENLHQQRLIANPTAEIDSMVEHLAELARTATPGQRPHIRALLSIARDLAQSNGREGDRESRVAGVVDALAADLRRAESAQRHDRLLGVRSLARALRGPLEIIVNARRHDGTAYVGAVHAIEDVLRSVPAAHLIDNASLRNELGVAKYTRLVEFLGERAA